MKKMIGQIVTLRAALWVNSFLYYFQRLWLVGKLVPNSVYTSYGLKKVLSYVALALRQIVDFCCKPLYLLAFLGAPALMLAGMYPVSYTHLHRPISLGIEAASGATLSVMSCQK